MPYQTAELCILFDSQSHVFQAGLKLCSGACPYTSDCLLPLSSAGTAGMCGHNWSHAVLGMMNPKLL